MAAYSLTSGDGSQARLFTVLSQTDSVVTCEVTYPGDPSIPSDYSEFQEFTTADFEAQIVANGILQG